MRNLISSSSKYKKQIINQIDSNLGQILAHKIYDCKVYKLIIVSIQK